MTVKEQLEAYCECIKNDVNEKDVEELINLISVYTCWAAKVCDTFLSAERKEVVDLPDCNCSCDVFTFDPFYAPFNPESFTFTLIEQNGIEETATELTDWVYSVVDENFRIKLPLDSCGCTNPCGCKSNYKLLVMYIAGYDELPECLLPVFCEALQWIKDKNTCDCSECIPCNTDNYEKNINEIDYTNMEGHLQDYFVTVLSVQYRNMLSLISLCDRDRKKLWAVVV